MKRNLSLELVMIIGCAAMLPAPPTRGAEAAPTSPTQAPAPKQARPPGPTRSPTAPGTPKLTPVGAKAGAASILRGAPGMNPPVDADGDFLIGPEYVRAPEL